MFFAYHIESVEVVASALILVYVLPLESVTDVIAVVTPESSETLTTIKLPDVVLAPNAADVYVPVPVVSDAVTLCTNAIAITLVPSVEYVY